MNRILSIVFFLILAETSLYSQQRTAAAPAMLQLTGLTLDGTEVTAQSQELAILYEPGYAKGELAFNSVGSPDISIADLFRNNEDNVLYFNITIPEGKFAFGTSLEEQFDTRGIITIGEINSEFGITFTVSHNKTSDQNTFLVIGQGRLSLSENFNLPDTLGLQDSFTFLFTQNLKVFTP